MINLVLNDDNSATLFLKGEITGVCPEIPNGLDLLRIDCDSFGGDFFLGLDLFRAIKSAKPKRSIARVRTSMSAATLPCCACDLMEMSGDSIFMIHGVSAVGITCNAEEARRLARELDGMNSQLAGIYAESCKAPKASIAEMIKAETYLSAEQMRDLGFNLLIVKNSKKKSVRNSDNVYLFAACADFAKAALRRINMEEEQKKEEEKKGQECKAEGEPAPETEEVPEEKPALTEERVREICVEVFNQLFANLKNEEEKESDDKEGDENGTGAELPEEKQEEEESVEDKVATAVKAERSRIAALNSYAGLADQSFLSTAIESGLSESEFAIEVLRQQKIANEKRRQQISSTAPLAPVQNYSEPTKSEPKADPKKLMNLIFG